MNKQLAKPSASLQVISSSIKTTAAILPGKVGQWVARIVREGAPPLVLKSSKKSEETSYVFSPGFVYWIQKEAAGTYLVLFRNRGSTHFKFRLQKELAAKLSKASKPYWDVQQDPFFTEEDEVTFSDSLEDALQAIRSVGEVAKKFASPVWESHKEVKDKIFPLISQLTAVLSKANKIDSGRERDSKECIRLANQAVALLEKAYTNAKPGYRAKRPEKLDPNESPINQLRDRQARSKEINIQLETQLQDILNDLRKVDGDISLYTAVTTSCEILGVRLYSSVLLTDGETAAKEVYDYCDNEFGMSVYLDILDKRQILK